MTKFTSLSDPKPTLKKSLNTDGTIDNVSEGFKDFHSVPKDEAGFLTYWKYDPKVWELIDGKIGQWAKQTKAGELGSFQFSVRKIVNAEVPLDMKRLDKFWNSAPKPSKSSYSKRRTDRVALVIPTSDEQIGKQDVHGGTEQTLERLNELLETTYEYALDIKPDVILLPHVGDLTEGFQNTSAQRATNDLSESLQFEAALLYRSKWLHRFGQIAPLKTGGVSSNHDVDRIGKGLAGKASDDKGLVINRLAAKFAQSHGIEVEHFEPESDFLEWNIIDVLGWKVGLIHGHQIRGGASGVKSYFDKHTASNSSLSRVDVLIAAHNHEAYDIQIGRGASGRARKAIGLAPLDNGSGWFTNLTAADSDPGVTTFIIREKTGLDLTSIKRWHRDVDTVRSAA